MGIYVENTFEPQWAWGCGYTNTAQATSFGEAGTPVSLTRETDYSIAESVGMDLTNTPFFITKYSGLYYMNVSASFSGGLNDEFTMFFTQNDIQIEGCQVNWMQKGANYCDVRMATLHRISGNGSVQIDVQIQNDSDVDTITLRKFTMTMAKLF